ncbi:hypothetical protein H8N00_17695 [Streptomyces sp. AC563]|uniref:hypothetical protein n=1 Tax=Streptomyces buecherae TaxID=2763006 RepID=UPI00164D1DE3|nr:hypothetical protein [Streptomyces buecherae]MBC3990677.1 hypothetical protein [Streptomyces buecherae]
MRPRARAPARPRARAPAPDNPHPAAARHLPGAALADRYLADRTDGPRPSSGEDFLLASVRRPTGPAV